MAYVINDDCINCGACAAGCPVEAISEGASHMEINADVCVDCGACAGVCPVGASKPTVDYIQLFFKRVSRHKKRTGNKGYSLFPVLF